MKLQVDGHNVYAVTAGSTDDPGLILLHGAGMDHTFWRYLPRALAAQGWFVVAPDLPGHSRSDGELLPDIDSMAAWVQRLAEAADMPTFALAGHSMGSLIALQAAANAGHACQALALVGNAYPMQVGESLLVAAAEGDPSIHSLTTLFGTTLATRLYGAWPPGCSQLNLRLSQRHHESPGVLHNDLSACNNYRHGEAAAAKVTAPTLFISGDQDRMTPAKATAVLRGQLADASLTLLTECAHQHSFEKPQALLQALGGFLQNAR